MTKSRKVTPRRTLVFFLFALTGSLTGTLVAPRIVGEFDGAAVWLLPAIIFVTILLALVAAYIAFHLATKSKLKKQSGRVGAA